MSDHKSMKIFVFLLVFIFPVTVLFTCESGKKEDASQSEKAVASVFGEQAFAQAEKVEKNQNLTNRRATYITEVVQRVNSAVVGINVIQLKKYVQRAPFYSRDPLWQMLWPELFQDREIVRKLQSLGSGFLISEDGYIVTNQHVVEDAAEVVVTTTDGKQHQAEIVGMDLVSDLALLKIEGNGFNFIPFGNSDSVMIGEWVIAFGNPFGLFQLNAEPTVTVGVISAVDRDWGKIDQSGRIYLDMLQTDAAINSGNSGGPLVNVNGECIGVNTFIYTGSSNSSGFIGIGFAIPSNKVKEIITLLKTKGSIDRNIYTGLEVQDISSAMAQALGISRKGVIVIRVDRDSPAEKAGVREDDVIIAIENKLIESVRDARNVLDNLDLKVGDPLHLTIVRNGKEMKITLILEKYPKGR